MIQISTLRSTVDNIQEARNKVEDRISDFSTADAIAALRAQLTGNNDAMVMPMELYSVHLNRKYRALDSSR